MPATARPGPLTVLPSGEQFEIRADGQRATIVEVGGGLREYEAAHDPERHKLEGARAGHPERVIPSHRMGRNSP